VMWLYQLICPFLPASVLPSLKGWVSISGG
jgi:hypothetical protein